MMIELRVAKESDSEFTSIVERMVNNAVRRTNPLEVYVVEVDGWFDYKWQRFSGTVMHEISVWRGKLTLPPFHPSRILSERHFRLDPDSKLYAEAQAKPLHIHQPSVQNLQRTIRSVSASGLFVWYSQISKDADRASLMLYTVNADDASAWYAGFTKKGEWELAQVNGTSRKAAGAFLRSGNPASKLLRLPR